jgi:hypothetical protein
LTRLDSLEQTLATLLGMYEEEDHPAESSMIGEEIYTAASAVNTNPVPAISDNHEQSDTKKTSPGSPFAVDLAHKKDDYRKN